MTLLENAPPEHTLSAPSVSAAVREHECDGVREPVRILIVDDSDDQRHLLRRYFELAGCEVVTAASAEGAIGSYASFTPDIAVVDLILPGMDGWMLSARIRSDHPDCSVVITSVLDAEDYPASEAVLPKPVSRSSVHRVLRSCIPGWVAP